jgi:2-aminoethylphosphonate dioxygenase
MTTFHLKPVPGKPGDVLFFDSYVPHASKPNHTDRARRSVKGTIAVASTGIIPPQTPAVAYRTRIDTAL